MKKFKEYLEEQEVKGTKGISAKDLQDKIGMTRMRAMSKHPFYQQYIRDYSHPLRPAIFTHSKNNLGHKVQSTADGRTMVRFDFHNYKVSNAHLFRWDGVSRTPSGYKMWIHKKSYREDDE